MSEFGIETRRTEQGKDFVDGRIFNGTIHRDGKFTKIFKLVPKDMSNPYGPQRREAERDVDIKILSIMLYGNFVEELDAGYTAELEISGAESISLQQGDVLEG